MIRSGIQIDSREQKAKSKKGEYLAFTFFEKNHGMELEVAGWAKLGPHPDKPDYIRSIVNPWGADIPVIDLRVLYGKGRAEMKPTTCIVILEDPQSCRNYFGMVVDELSNIVNVSEGTENRMSSLLLSARRHLSTNPMLTN